MKAGTPSKPYKRQRVEDSSVANTQLDSSPINETISTSDMGQTFDREQEVQNGHNAQAIEVASQMDYSDPLEEGKQTQYFLNYFLNIDLTQEHNNDNTRPLMLKLKLNDAEEE